MKRPGKALALRHDHKLPRRGDITVAFIVSEWTSNVVMCTDLRGIYTMNGSDWVMEIRMAFDG